MSTTAGRGDLFEPAGEKRIVREVDDVTVEGGELTQARRPIKNGAPVSRVQ
ncbi:hypothetical protein ABXV03_03570 [Streptomyces harbinensis]|uniref:hypothetical protein n=1 Tax=Streptomyces harbinensis TaxID=1176198 RepID=UPI0033981831